MLSEFQKDLRTLTLEEALTKHNLNLKDAFNILHCNNYQLNRRVNRNSHKHIIVNKDKTKFTIQKCVNGKNIHFGTYNSLKDAQTIRNHCIKYGWIQDNVNQYCHIHNITRCNNYKCEGKYGEVCD